MNIEFDHLVVAARSLDEGARWVESRLGVAPVAGGRHAAMGTHNRLLGLGPGRFLEVLAVDPDAGPPGRARWFELDAPRLAARLASAPFLHHWVVRTDDIEAAVRAFAPDAEVLDLERGEYRWSIGVPRDGGLRQGGVFPTFIQWRSAHPAGRLPDAGCRLEALALGGAHAGAMLAALRAAGYADEATRAEPAIEGLAARFSTPGGAAQLGNSAAARVFT